MFIRSLANFNGTLSHFLRQQSLEELESFFDQIKDEDITYVEEQFESTQILNAFINKLELLPRDRSILVAGKLEKAIQVTKSILSILVSMFAVSLVFLNIINGMVIFSIILSTTGVISLCGGLSELISYTNENLITVNNKKLNNLKLQILIEINKRMHRDIMETYDKNECNNNNLYRMTENIDKLNQIGKTINEENINTKPPLRFSTWWEVKKGNILRKIILEEGISKANTYLMVGGLLLTTLGSLGIGSIASLFLTGPYGLLTLLGGTVLTVALVAGISLYTTYKLEKREHEMKLIDEVIKKQIDNKNQMYHIKHDLERMQPNTPNVNHPLEKKKIDRSLERASEANEQASSENVLIYVSNKIDKLNKKLSSYKNNIPEKSPYTEKQNITFFPTTKNAEFITNNKVASENIENNTAYMLS